MLSLSIAVAEAPHLRVYLRPVELHDAPDILKIWSVSEVMRFYDVAPLQTLDEARELVTAMMRERENGTGVRWAIVLRGSGQLIGTCGFRLDHQYKSATLGFELAREQWGGGLMYEALLQGIDHAYSCWGINRIQATTNLSNDASIRLLSKLRFQNEGVMRQWGYWKGQFHDVGLFSLIRVDHEVAGLERSSPRATRRDRVPA